MRTLAGLETADSGTFLLDGSTFDPTSSKQQEQVVGVVFQDFQLFPHLSVMDNITIGPRLVLKQDKETYTSKANHLAKLLDIEELLNNFPYQLSGGQKQRLAIARAMAMNPKVLAYDEPTSALDPALRQQVASLILELKADGVTQIVVTHDLDFAEEIGDKVLKVEHIK